MGARALMGPALLLASLVAAGAPEQPVPAAAAEPSGPVSVAGNGPELPLIQELAKAFEKTHRRAYVDIFWHDNAKPVELLKAGEAQIAVTGKPEPGLRANQVGWDGIAIMVHVSNYTKDLTKRQIADIFSGKVKNWSELGGPELRIVIIDRAWNQNIRDAFLEQLGIPGRMADSLQVISPEQKAINTVVGVLPPRSAVTYLSLRPALKAVDTGVAVRLLTVDMVEPEIPTVKDGRYPLRRPVLFLTKEEPTPAVEAFLEFARSPEGQAILEAEGYVGMTGK